MGHKVRGRQTGERVWKNQHFQPITCYISETVQEGQSTKVTSDYD